VEFGLYNVLEMKELLIKLVSIIFLFLAPIHTLILLITIIIIVDTFAGRWCAAQLAIRDGLNPRDVVTSGKTRRGVMSKFIGYNLALLFTFCLDKYLLQEIVLWIMPGTPIAFLCTKIVGLLIISIELSSIDEKWYRVKGYSIWDVIIKRLRSVKALYGEFKKPQE